MKRLMLALPLVLLLVPSQAGAQDPAQTCLTMPKELSGFRVTQTKVFPDSADGTGYQLTDGSPDRVTVFIYPIPADARVGNDVRPWVSTEGQKFKEMLRSGVQRRWWQTYTVILDHPDSVAVAGEHLPGYLVVGGTRLGNNVTVEFQYVFGICDHFVKMRATLGSGSWEQSHFPTFSKDLAAYLRQH